MNKIASYLNEHLLGYVSAAKSVRKEYATDGSVLTITPESVAFPQTTNDIRKIARFTWQLAEKGHIIGMTPRGLGLDVTGAALGRGVVIDAGMHLNKVLQILPKEKLVHVQPGIRLSTLQETLKWQGLALPFPTDEGTVGGAIASDYGGTNGSIAGSVEKLEIILSNGDVIETGRVSKRELSKKLGLQTLEGDIYRKLEALIEDNSELIERIANGETRDNTGYARVADVRLRDGSFDLTPLFIASQGTLGIISEVVLRTDFYNQDSTYTAIITTNTAMARDIADRLLNLQPDEITIYDGALYQRMHEAGAAYNLIDSLDNTGALVLVKFNDFSTRSQIHKLKKLRKILKKDEVKVVASDEHPTEDFEQLTRINQENLLSDKIPGVPSVTTGAYIPMMRQEEFENGLQELAHKQHIDLPFRINVLNGTYDVLPELKLSSVSDKQKLFRLMTEFGKLVIAHGGSFMSDGAEGRLKATSGWDLLETEEQALYTQVREIFDPFSTLNPGVKQRSELRALVAALRSAYHHDA